MGLALFAFSVTGTTLLHRSADRALDASLQQTLRGTAAAAALAIDPTLHAQIRTADDEASPACQRAIEPLEALVRALPGLRAVHTFRPTSDGGLQWVLDLEHPAPGASLPHAHPGVPCLQADSTMLEAIREGRTAMSTAIETDARGSFVRACEPVAHAPGGEPILVCIEFDAADSMASASRIHVVVGIAFAIAAAGSTGAGAAVAGWYGRRLKDERRSLAARAQLERARTDAVRASQAKSDFVANVSHEIRTPMTAILGFAEVLREERVSGVPGELGDEALDAIIRNGEHLLGIVNDIVDVSRIEGGNLEIRRVPIDVVSVAQDAVSLLAGRARGKGLTIALTSDGPTEACTDPLRLRQILLNLVGNAIKFTDHGGVGVHVRTDGRDALLTVADTGPGMDQPQLDRLFRRYSQVTPERAAGGSGLGLALSRELARMLGGDITVESTPGQGARFRVRLPMETPVSVAESAAFTCDVPAATSNDLTGMRILLADDGPDNVRLFRHHLTRAGAEVTVAVNGREAVALVRAAALGVLEEPFDLVLMDLEMPVMDGTEAARTIRVEAPGLPIIALTAQSASVAGQRCVDTGFVAVASKPIDRRALVRLAQHWGRKSPTGTPAVPAEGLVEA